MILEPLHILKLGGYPYLIQIVSKPARTKPTYLVPLILENGNNRIVSIIPFGGLEWPLPRVKKLETSCRGDHKDLEVLIEEEMQRHFGTTKLEYERELGVERKIKYKILSLMDCLSGKYSRHSSNQSSLFAQHSLWMQQSEDYQWLLNQGAVLKGTVTIGVSAGWKNLGSISFKLLGIQVESRIESRDTGKKVYTLAPSSSESINVHSPQTFTTSRHQPAMRYKLF
ncbi:uncharacterized protein LY89DRAFT_754303 [Mollisia scopiformis]|uniref:Uncharacterized protein n=1 Tax=Mollisia scopiformis TaxID=149040 RepID=A0A194WZX3_MOLSC|nr:uncharacterized protein LY89DRAFT_754303 [Mollisia scopiformis]KUJ13495.1 hypothetical protein LY89DRAFT_754303 [Mollisia scopiformis]